MNTENEKIKADVDSFVHELEGDVATEFKKVIDALSPAIASIHSYPPTTKDYYGDYMGIMSINPKILKVVSLALVAAGANPKGVKAAYDILSKNNDCV